MIYSRSHVQEKHHKFLDESNNVKLGLENGDIYFEKPSNVHVHLHVMRFL